MTINKDCKVLGRQEQLIVGDIYIDSNGKEVVLGSNHYFIQTPSTVEDMKRAYIEKLGVGFGKVVRRF